MSKQAENFEIRPYKTLDEVRAFQRLVAEGNVPAWMDLVPDMTEGSQYCTPHVDLLKNPRPAFKRNSVPKTLVCHDYMGGYLDDRFVDANLDGGGNIYAFKQWCMIDTFVYFSHYLVTVPTRCYIAAAHAHGVPILGTVITEGPTGAAICKEFLKDDGIEFAANLALISQVHKFDGYLINIENHLSTEEIPKMINFLKHLRKKLPDESQIIWYDSVTDTGSLKWQNELNSKNYEFFNVCDGIYLNYNYTMEKLEMSSLLADHRKHDVYVGVDVFGRGCPGSGFSSLDAVEMARTFDLSVAIFAPAWTKEVVPGDASKNNDIFWTSLSKHLYVHGIRAESKSLIVADGRFSIGNNSDGLYPLTMPSVDRSEEHRVLILFQRDLPNWKNYHSRLPQPILEIKKLDDGYHEIHIEKSQKLEYRSIPLMLFEAKLKNGLKVGISCKGQDGENDALFYVVVENPRNLRKEVYKAHFKIPSRSTEWFPGLTGTLLEIGVELPPKVQLAINYININTAPEE